MIYEPDVGGDPSSHRGMPGAEPRLWARLGAYQPVLSRFLPDYLDGKQTLRATIDQIIAALPPSS